MNSLKKLDWIVNDEPDLIWTSPAQFGAPLTLGAQGKLSMLPYTEKKKQSFYPARAWYYKKVTYVYLIGSKAVLYPLLFQQFPIQ